MQRDFIRLPGKLIFGKVIKSVDPGANKTTIKCTAAVMASKTPIHFAGRRAVASGAQPPSDPANPFPFGLVVTAAAVAAAARAWLVAAVYVRVSRMTKTIMPYSRFLPPDTQRKVL